MSRTFFFIVVCGLLLGSVLYCWQTALIAFDAATGLDRPLRLWSLEKTHPDGLVLEVLGKKWQLK